MLHYYIINLFIYIIQFYLLSINIKLNNRFSLIINYFSFLLSNEDVSNTKPDPEIYLKAINKLGLKSEEVVIVEDNFNGIKAAKAAGGNVLEVKTIEDVNYKNIKGFIDNLN